MLMPDSSPTILLVDDEDSVRKVLAFPLERDGYLVVQAADGEEALARFAAQPIDLVVLDIMLPKLDGLEVCKRLRATSSVPIIMLSARAEEVDRILGLEFGADDYVTKPFSPRELVSRVRSVLRRAGAASDSGPNIVVGDVRIDNLARQVRVSDVPIELTRTEYEILLHLARHPGTAFSREDMLASLGDASPFGDERVVDVHIHNLREKIERDPKAPTHILTVRGFGYRLGEPRTEESPTAGS